MVDAAAVVADDLQGIGAVPLHVLHLILAQIPYGGKVPLPGAGAVEDDVPFQGHGGLEVPEEAVDDVVPVATLGEPLAVGGGRLECVLHCLGDFLLVGQPLRQLLARKPPDGGHLLQEHSSGTHHTALLVELDAGVEGSVNLLRLGKVPGKVLGDVPMSDFHRAGLGLPCPLVEAGDGDGAGAKEGCEVPAFQWFVQGDGILQQIAPDGAGAVGLGGKASCRSVGVVAEGEAAAALHGGNHQGGGQAGLAENHGLQNAQLVVCAHLVYKPGAMEEGSTEKAVGHHEYGHAVLVDMVKVVQQVLVLNLCFDHTNTILLFSQGFNHVHLRSPVPPCVQMLFPSLTSWSIPTMFKVPPGTCHCIWKPRGKGL